MDDRKYTKDHLVSSNNDICNELKGKLLPIISLKNQNSNLLKLNRYDTFRLVIYFYSMTGHPKKKLPENWNNIPGARGCTLQNCSFRDNYENFIKLNSLPIGISTQSIEEIKEMTNRLCIKYDILSDLDLHCTNQLSLPTFSIKNKTFIKRLTLIVEKNIIKQVFYPIVSIDKHINEVMEWLKKN